MGRAYRVVHGNMGSVDKARGPDPNGVDFTQPGRRTGTGKGTGYDGYLSAGDARGKYFTLQWDPVTTMDLAGSEAHGVEDVNGSDDLRANREDPTATPPRWSDATWDWTQTLKMDPIPNPPTFYVNWSQMDPDWNDNYFNGPQNAGPYPRGYIEEHAFTAFLDSGTVNVRLRTDDSRNTMDSTPGSDPTNIDLSMSPRRSARSEFRLKFIRHNFYQSTVPGSRENGVTGPTATQFGAYGGYWNRYRYYATYEATTKRSNRAGLDANRTFYVVGIPMEANNNAVGNNAGGAPIILRQGDGNGTYSNAPLFGNMDALRNIIPVSGFSLTIDYTSNQMTDPWRPPGSPGGFVWRDGWDATVWLVGGYHPQWNRSDARFPPPAVGTPASTQAPIRDTRTVYRQGGIAARAERITHPEDLDMANFIEIQRGSACDIGGVNGPPLTLNPALIDNAIQWINPRNNAGNDLYGEGTLRQWSHPETITTDLEFAFVDGGEYGTLLNPLTGIPVEGAGNMPDPTLNQTQWVGIPEYDRNTGYQNTRLFGDFFVNPVISTTNILGNLPAPPLGPINAGTAFTAQAGGGANSSAVNVIATPGVPQQNNLISTRNLNEVMKLGDLGVKIRRMNRLPSMYGPEYILSNQWWDPNRSEWVLNLQYPVGPPSSGGGPTPAGQAGRIQVVR